jgi:hypothetical protein
MHDNAYAHDLQVLNACVTPGCYTRDSARIDHGEHRHEMTTPTPDQRATTCYARILKRAQKLNYRDGNQTNYTMPKRATRATNRS